MGYKSLLFPFFYREKNFSINKHVIAKFFFSFFSFAKKSANCQAPHEAPLKMTQKGHFKNTFSFWFYTPLCILVQHPNCLLYMIIFDPIFNFTVVIHF